MTKQANIFSIPAGVPFLDCLARAILTGNLPIAGGQAPQPHELPDMTLILPTRRATRAMVDAFLRVGEGRALLLPKIIPISEGDEDAALISSYAAHVTTDMGTTDIPPAMGELERRLTLAGLIMRWSEALLRSSREYELSPVVTAGISTPAQAATLAAELAQLMDMVETEDKTLDGLASLVPEMFSAHWQQTLTFLEIVTQAWPLHLKERGLMSPAGRRNAVIRAEALRLASSPPDGPVIVAGVSGSVPATVDLIRAAAHRELGAVVLPALDTVLDDASWQEITRQPDSSSVHPEHPQFGLKRLLDQLGVPRGDVRVLGDGDQPVRSASFISEAMRPARTTALWEQFAGHARDDRSLVPDGLSLIEAPTAQDEAEAVALILREAAETPGKTAALVSPDRLLARRVAVRLESWGVRVDDSAGRPFRKTPPGAFLDLVIAAVSKRFQPAELMALLKHPLTRLGLDPFSVRRAGRALEIIAFRGPYLGDGLQGADAAIERARQEMTSRQRVHRSVSRLWDEDWDGAKELVRRLARAAEPLVSLFESEARQQLSVFAEAHIAAAEAIAQHAELGSDQPDERVSPVWQGDAGETGAQIFAGLSDTNLPQLDIAAADYPDLYRSLVGTENVRPRGAVHPRISIWGPFEARLQQPDIVVLGSLNDGTWPKAADPGAWLNRPMREALGLPSPEEKIGQAAHDFATLLHAPEVVLTRAEKIDGVPTVPSRWLMRLRALLRGMDAEDALKTTSPWLSWARARDQFVPTARLKAPEPRPPVALRPRKLSVSRIETWIANPYAIFAQEILGLEPLDTLGAKPGPSLRGTIIHEALSRFASLYPDRLPKNVTEELLKIAREMLDAYAAHPRIAAFWVPRFQRFAEWFAATEPLRRKASLAIFAETSGSMQLDLPGGPFQLTARADRIDVVDGALVITDYKTGRPPSNDRVTSFVSPQLPLEAAIALSDIGFADVPQGLPVSELRYIRASGGEPAGEQTRVKTDDVHGLAASAVDGLSRHVSRFDDETTPYRSLRRQRFHYDYDEFAHLARVAEWSAGASYGDEV